MKSIEKMSDAEILQFVRDERLWMIESVFTKNDLEKKCNRKFSDFEWPVFRNFICTVLDKESITIAKKVVKDEEEAWSKISWK